MKRLLRFFLRYLIGGILFLAGSYGLTYYFQNMTEAETSKPFQSAVLPDITHLNQHGDSINYQSFQGKPVIIDFWFGGCKPCLEEMRYFPELLKKYKDEFVILSYSIDSREHTLKLLNKEQKAWDFLEKDNPNWQFLNTNFDKGEMVESLGVKSYPTYFLINKEGELVKSAAHGIYLIESQFSSVFSGEISNAKTYTFYKKRVLGKFIVVYQLVVIFVLILQALIFAFRKYILKHQISY